MFSGHISNIISNRYPRAIREALNYIKNTDFDKLEAGRYPIKGDLIYAQVLDLETKDKSLFQPEIENENQILLLPGRFAVFFPEDTHRSHQFDGKPSRIRKIVVKVALSELEQA